MYRLRHSVIILTTLLLAGTVPAQEKHNPPAKTAVTKDVDPLSLDVLRAVAEPVEKVQTFSFRALVAEEELATNDQIVMFFHTVDVMVQRPDKLHLISKDAVSELISMVMREKSSCFRRTRNSTQRYRLRAPSTRI